MICGVSRWMECAAHMTRLQHLPSCCGGLRWTVTHKFCGFGITEEFCRGAARLGDAAAWRGGKMGDEPSVVRPKDAKAVVAFENSSPTSLNLRQRRT